MAAEHGGLRLGGDAKALLKGEALLQIVRPPERQERRRGRERGRARSQAPNPVGDPLFDALRELRRTIASDAQVPPYVVFHDATLREMASSRPGSLAELGTLPGVGAKKLEAYGEAFLKAIRDT